MNTFNKKNLIIAAVILFILAGIGFSIYYFQARKAADVKESQTKMEAGFKDKSFNTSYSATGSNLKGVLDKSQNFQGDILSKGSVVQNIIKVGDKVYTKSPNGNTWLVQKNPAFLTKITLMSHPAYVKLDKFLSKDKDGNLEYSIFYDQSSGIISNKAPKVKRGEHKPTGTALLNKQTKELMGIKLHQGTDAKNDITINYTINSSPPVITEPKT